VKDGRMCDLNLIVKVLDMNIKVFPSLNLLGYTSIKSVIFSSLHGGVKDGRGMT
jgi:hypothetical protein